MIKLSRKIRTRLKTSKSENKGKMTETRPNMAVIMLI